MSRSRALKNLAKALSKKLSVAGKRRPAAFSTKKAMRKPGKPTKIQRSGRMSNLELAELRGGDAGMERAAKAMARSEYLTGRSIGGKTQHILERARDAGERTARKDFLASGRKVRNTRKGVSLKRKSYKRKRRS